jgi:hypothetical protein
MALDGERQLVCRHAAAVIGNRDQPAPAVLQCDIDARGACIDRVFNQFLDCRGGTLDDLARGDAVNEDRRQKTDRHRRSLC